MNHTVAAAILAGLIAGAPPALAQPAAPSPAPDAALLAAVDHPARAPANRDRDIWRRPAQTLAFWGVRPGATVLEISPGGGWWTEILAPYARATGGRYIATAAPLEGPGASANAITGRRNFETRFADPAVYGRVELVPFAAGVRGLGQPNSVDVAFTARNIHNWMGQPGRVDEVFADLFAVLKPGGLLGVKEHRSDPNPMKPGASDGYVSEAYVIAAATKAGFVLDARSELNANPRDTKDHPFGVWTLPPSRNSSPGQGQPTPAGFDRAKYDAIGESDRMTLRFRKPG